MYLFIVYMSIQIGDAISSACMRVGFKDIVAMMQVLAIFCLLSFPIILKATLI